MDWLDDAKVRIKRKNKILFSKDSEYLSDLALLLGEQNHRTVVLWALDLGSSAAEKLRAKYPEEKSPASAGLLRSHRPGAVPLPPARSSG